MADHPSNRPTYESLGDLFYARSLPTVGQHFGDGEVRDAGRHFAEAILRHCPPCADTSAAIRKAREAVMVACAAIALDSPADSPAAV